MNYVTMLTVEQAAKVCSVSISTIYDMAKKNTIPHTRIGNRVLFHKDVLDDWLRNGN